MRPSRKRIFDELRTQYVVAGRRGIAFVEDEIDRLENRSEASAPLRARRHFERYPRLRERALRANDALRDRRFRDEKSARDFGGSEAADELERERDVCLFGYRRMTRDEDQAEHVVVDILVGRSKVIGRFGNNGIARVLFGLAFERLRAANLVDRAPLRSGHQPRARIARDACARPLRDGRDEGILCEVFGAADVA